MRSLTKFAPGVGANIAIGLLTDFVSSPSVQPAMTGFSVHFNRQDPPGRNVSSVYYTG